MAPLAGVRVIDFGQYVAGPFATMVMADLGAEVIKVEAVTGDRMRALAAPFFSCQRGKRSLALDVRTPAGHDLALELVATADVVHHNMTKGTAERLGIDYEACRRVRPDVVYCNTSAYGPDGPLSDFGGIDPIGQAVAGIEYESAPVELGNPPMWYRFGFGDQACGLLSAYGVVAALYRRARTGEGGFVTSSLLDGSVLFSSDTVLVGEPGHTEVRKRPPLDVQQTGFGALHRLYRARDDEWIQLAAVTDAHWRALCPLVGRPELVDDPWFATVKSRAANRAELEEILEPVFASRTALAWLQWCDEAGVPCEISVDTIGGELVMFDADNVRLGLVREYEHPLTGRTVLPGHFVTFPDTAETPSSPPPLLGEHSREILGELGYDDAAVDRLIAEGVVGEPGPGYDLST
jgi:crotonobetainyl-CoA:carnitine CoA-transferase CaiB-like acyl-CoA transferase